MKSVRMSVMIVWVLSSILLAILVFGCGEEGEEGTVGIDCGPFGSEHDGHCHCDAGYLFDGDTCVTPSEVSEICEDHEEESSDTDTAHNEGACVCPDAGECPCEGTVEELGGVEYCVPAVHEE